MEVAVGVNPGYGAGRSNQADRSFAWSEDGQGMVEYGLILGLMVLAGVAALTYFGEELARFFNLVSGYLVSAMASVSTGS